MKITEREVCITANEFFWDSVEEIAIRENTSVNSLVVKVLTDYIMKTR
jgi:predicted DNA-binding ribbon-helix-helix protein